MNTGTYARWDGAIIHMTGVILLFLGIVMFLPVLTAIIYSEHVTPFLVPMAICIIAAVPMMLLFRMPVNMSSTDGLFLVASAFVIAIIIGSIPFMLSGMDAVDAIFESTSGFTTTGSTVISDFGEWSHSILLWRSLTQWIGGIAIILIFMSVLPLLGIGGKMLSINEMYSTGSKNFSARIRDVAKEFVIIYLVLTMILMLICVFLGVNVFESLCMTFSTVSTGGMLPVSSMAVYSDAIQIVVMAFMFLGGTSFYLHYKAIYKREVSGYVRNTEFKVMVIWFLIMTVLLFTGLVGMYGGTEVFQPSLESFKDTLFTVISLGTSTGFATVDFAAWPYAALLLLALLMFVGASSGSTSGGVKIYRIVLIGKYIRTAMQRLIYPRGVFDVKVDKTSVDDNTISSAVAIVMLFAITIIIGSIVCILFGVDPLDAISMVLASVMNSGSALGGEYGPMDSFAPLPGPLKIILSVLMWAGRLEIVMALVIFTSSFWKEMMRRRTKAVR